jgi:hypothetical protein
MVRRLTSGPPGVRSFRPLAGGGGAILLGAVLACYGVPHMVLIPTGGVLADKAGPRTVTGADGGRRGEPGRGRDGRRGAADAGARAFRGLRPPSAARLLRGRVFGTLASARTEGLHRPTIFAPAVFLIEAAAIAVAPYQGGEAGGSGPVRRRRGQRARQRHLPHRAAEAAPRHCWGG